MKILFICTFLLLSITRLGYCQYSDEPLEPKVTYGMRLSLCSPHAWLKLHPPFNLALTFDRKKSFFLIGLDFWLPENRNTDTTTSWLAGMGLQFSYGRYLSNVAQKGFYLIYNFRYQDTFEHWRGREWVQGPKSGISLPTRHRRLDYETWESIVGFGIKIPVSSRFYLDLMTGAGASVNIDYNRHIDVSLHPAFEVRGGLGYQFK